MKNKWHHFQSSYSPVEIDKPNTAGGNLALDWKRESSQNRMFINSVPLSEYAKEYNGFNTKEDVKNFFGQIILKDMPDPSSEKRSEIVDYLEKAFHQGGFMYPVSGAFSISMEEYNEELNQSDKYATVGEMDMMINIQTTASGFKVQEISKVKFLFATPGTSGEAMANEEYRILPDPGKDYVVSLQGTIDIDFTKNTKSPSISIESNGISYGHEGIKSRIDPRHFGQKIVDFFKSILGLNQVEIISSKVEKNDNLSDSQENTMEQPKV